MTTASNFQLFQFLLQKLILVYIKVPITRRMFLVFQVVEPKLAE